MQINGATTGLSEYYTLLRQQQQTQLGTDVQAATGADAAAAASNSWSSYMSAAVGDTAETDSAATDLSDLARGAPPAGGGGGGQVSSSGGGGTATSTVEGDTDGDGVLSAEELAALLAEQEAESGGTETAAQQPEPPPGGMPPGGAGMPEYSASMSYGDLMNGMASGTGSASSSFMQNMISSAYAS